MIIGIDASRAYVSDKTGTEYYSYHIINEMLRLPEAKLHTFVLFIRPNAILPKELDGYSNVIVKSVKMRYLWTQIGLAAETWKKFVNPYSRIAVNPDSNHINKRIHGFTDSRYLEVLWVPAHTLPLLRNPQINTVVTIHGIEYKWLPEYKNLLQRWYLPLSTIYATKQADQLIAVSEFTAKQLEKELHTDKKKIKVIHEGVARASIAVNPYSRKSVMEKYGIEDKKYLLFMGSIQPRKNLVALIQAFSRFGAGHPGYKLVIAGGVGWMAEDILQAPSVYGVQDKVVFTGRVSEEIKTILYSQALAYVQPSITEGFGLPILEAMAMGIPVISSDGGALREVVGEAGIIVNLKSQISNSQIKDNFVNSLARAMKTIVDDAKHRNNLIALGYKRVNEFTWKKAARETLSVISG